MRVQCLCKEVRVRPDFMIPICKIVVGVQVMGGQSDRNVVVAKDHNALSVHVHKRVQYTWTLCNRKYYSVKDVLNKIISLAMIAIYIYACIYVILYSAVLAAFLYRTRYTPSFCFFFKNPLSRWESDRNTETNGFKLVNASPSLRI